MRYLANGKEKVVEAVKFDRYEVFASVGSGARNSEDTMVSVFAAEDEFLDWVKRSDPRSAEQVSQLITGFAQLGMAHREQGPGLMEALQSMLEDLPQNNSPCGGLTLYEQINYGGRSLEVENLIPYVDLNMLPWRFNDKASSLKLESGVCAVFEHTWFKGRSWWIWPGPQNIPWIGEWWDDHISSCICGPSYEDVLKFMLKHLL